MSSKVLYFVIIFLAIFTRFFALNWGFPYHFHPDENNMATAVSSLSTGDLNPHFFAYGQFPLYLSFFSLFPVFGSHPPFSAAIIALRFWSAVFSLILLFFAYKISRLLFQKKSFSYVFLTLLIFHPGLIQIAHFGTTESILSACFIALFYYSIKTFHSPRLLFFLLAALFSAISLSSKITAIFFIWPFFLIALFRKNLLNLSIYFFLTLFLVLLFSPFNLIAFSDFLSTIRYETDVARGVIEVFYTRQFFDTSFLFPVLKIFPFVSGLFQFVFGLIGLILFIRQFSKNSTYWFLILIPTLIYFIYFSFIFTKWTRNFSPIFFVFPLFTTYFFTKINQKLLPILIFLSTVPGLLFFAQYFFPDTRSIATTWISQNLSKNVLILSESGNVTSLPYPQESVDFDFYELDFNETYRQNLYSQIAAADYILVPSRRVFANQKSPRFPLSGSYYQHLFDGSLGFSLEKTFSPLPYFPVLESAEETLSVFDRPTLRLFKKTKQLSFEEIKLLLYKSKIISHTL